MSTSVFYRAMGIRGYQPPSIPEQDEGLVMRVRHDGRELACLHCGGSTIVRRGRFPNAGRRSSAVTVLAEVPRIECRDCQTQPIVPVPFVAVRRSYADGFARHLPELRESTTLITSNPLG